MKRGLRWLFTALALGGLAGYVWHSRAVFAALLAQVDHLKFAALVLPLLLVSAVAPWANGRISRDLVACFGVQLAVSEAYALAVLNAFGNLTPVPQAGAMARGVYLRKVHGVDYTSYAATLAVTYVSSLSLTGLVGLLGLCALAARSSAAPWQLWFVFGGLAGCALLFSPWTASIPLPGRLAQFRQGLGRMRRQHVLVRLVVLQLLIIGLAATGLWLAANSLLSANPVTWLDSLMLALVSMVAAIANVLGVEQGAAMLCAALLGYDASLGLAASALYRLGSIAVVLLLAPIALRILKRHSRTVAAPSP